MYNITTTRSNLFLYILVCDFGVPVEQMLTPVYKLSK